MQTLEFTRALKRITDVLRIGELTGLITTWINTSAPVAISAEQKKQFADLLFQSNSAYRRLLENSNTRRILESLEVGQFYEPSRLATMITAVSNAPNSQNIYQNPQSLAQFYSFAELLYSLKRLETATVQLLQEEKIGEVDPSRGILELQVIQYADEIGISPKRLQVFASSITELHMHLALILGVTSDPVVFKYFDSGSDLRVGIECAKAIIDALSTLFNQWWDRIVYYRYDSFDKKIEALSKSLDIVDTVHQSVQRGTITQEEGENLKLRVFREVENLTEIGVAIPLSETATINQRQLLTEARNTKLLSDGRSSEPEAQTAQAQLDEK